MVDVVTTQRRDAVKTTESGPWIPCTPCPTSGPLLWLRILVTTMFTSWKTLTV